MKFLNLLAAFGLATATALPAMAETTGFKTAPKDDTVLVKLANGAKMSLIVKNTEQLKSFTNYSLDSLMIMLNTYIAEAEKMEKKDVNAKDYTVSFRPSEESNDDSKPEKINITIKKLNVDAGGKGEKKAVNIDVEYDNGEKDRISIGKTGVTVDTVAAEPKKKSRFDDGLNIDLGFNTFLNNENNMLDVVGLKPWGSRYVSLNPYYQMRVGREKSPFHIRTGLDFSFNNYMFDRNYVMKDSEVLGNNYTVLVKDERNLEKSKLATSSVNLPLMLLLDFDNKKGKSAFRIGAGGFVGYRLGAHTKIKYNLEGDDVKDKDHGNFNLEDLQYGVKATIGIYGLDLFANYNLNELFKDNRGPKANVLSFGITL